MAGASRDERVNSGRGLPSLEKYELIEEIGHGGMATVYRARDPRLGRDVAVKVIHPHLRESKEVAHRFAVEAQAVAKLRHPNIVEVFDVSEPGDPEQFLVVELLYGKTLRKVLQQREKLPPEVAAALGVELCSALAHAHEQGIIHRDVKPENVFLEHAALAGDSMPASVKRSKVKLMDFGIAKLLDAQGVTSTGQVLGSPAHMAPEQIEGGEVDARSDVFALGVLLYECMVGHLPFEGANPAQVLRRVLEGSYTPAEPEDPRIGKAFSGVLDRALAHEPEHRFADTLAMKDALEGELARLGVTDAKKELDDWLSDPRGYESEHDERMAKRLAELGHAARKRKDTLGAASDYNRALAYAPTDAALLRVVSGMQQNEARARKLRRALPIALVMIGVASVTFFVARAIRSQIKHPEPVVTLAALPPTESATATESAPVPTESAVPLPTRTTPAQHHAPIHIIPTTRRVTLAHVNLPAGVFVKVDDGAPAPAAQDDKLELDTKEHLLTFTCASDLCVPLKKTIPAGATDESLAIDLKIKDAILIVEGDPGKTYAIVEKPELGVQNGVPVHVPTSSGSAFDVTVKALGSEITKTVTLRPGQTSSLSFH